MRNIHEQLAYMNKEITKKTITFYYLYTWAWITHRWGVITIETPNTGTQMIKTTWHIISSCWQ